LITSSVLTQICLAILVATVFIFFGVSCLREFHISVGLMNQALLSIALGVFNVCNSSLYLSILFKALDFLLNATASVQEVLLYSFIFLSNIDISFSINAFLLALVHRKASSILVGFLITSGFLITFGFSITFFSITGFFDIF